VNKALHHFQPVFKSTSLLKLSPGNSFSLLRLPEIIKIKEAVKEKTGREK